MLVPTQLARLLQALLDRSAYLIELQEERTIEAEGRLENLAELIGAAQDFGCEVLDAGSATHLLVGTSGPTSETWFVVPVDASGAAVEASAQGPDLSRTVGSVTRPNCASTLAEI